MRRIWELVKRYKWTALGVGAGLIAVIGGLLIWQTVDAHRLSSDPEYSAQRLVKEVGRHIVLPAGEMPAVVTVVDIHKVQNIPFLQRSAQNGDKLLVYAKAKKVVLYRPSVKKIVDVGPVSVALPPKGQ